MQFALYLKDRVEGKKMISRLLNKGVRNHKKKW